MPTKNPGQINLASIVRVSRKDVMFSSWMLVFGTGIYLAILIYILYMNIYYSTNIFEMGSTCILFVGAISYYIGAIIFSTAAWDYSKRRDEIINDENVKEWPVMKNFFYGDLTLVAVWMFFLPTVFYLAIPPWLLIEGYISPAMAITSLCVLLVVVLLQFIWVYSSFPESLQANGNKGSSVFFDTLFCIKESRNSWWCVGFEVSTEARSDFVVGAWVYTIFSITLLVLIVFALSLYPDSGLLWSFFAAFGFLSFGFFIKATTSASPGRNTTYYFDTIACVKSVRLREKNSEEFPLVSG